MTSLSALRRDIKKFANPQKVKNFQRFFKTGKGEYGEGDLFLGLTVPQSRTLAIKYKNLPFSDISVLLKSTFHEERLIALLLLVYNFNKGTEEQREKIYEYYLKNTQYINNWDLVDLSADKIVGGYLLDNSSNILDQLVHSENVWERRIAIIATYQFIKNGRYDETFKIADMLLTDSHDLIHKAVGWMLREVGKRYSEETLKDFLKTRYKKMPRTMLRYAIERFDEKLRKAYLIGEI